MKNIKNILVATDFSDNSKAALDFAIGIAAALKAHIKVVHIYEASAGSIVEAKFHNDYKKDLDRFVHAKLLDLEALEVRKHIVWEVILGNPVNKLVELSHARKYDLLVMGVTGKKSIGEILFGSTATMVAQQACCPVLLVPSNVVYKGIYNIVYACDFEHSVPKHAKTVANIAQLFEANIHLLFVKTEDSRLLHHEAQAQLFTALFERHAPNLNLTSKIVEESTVIEGINDYCAEIKADLVAVVTQHRSFWQRLVHRSMTKEIALYAEEAVLIVHTD